MKTCVENLKIVRGWSSAAIWFEFVPIRTFDEFTNHHTEVIQSYHFQTIILSSYQNHTILETIWTYSIMNNIWKDGDDGAYRADMAILTAKKGRTASLFTKR